MSHQADNGGGIAHRTVVEDPRARYRRDGPADFGREKASACVTACFGQYIGNRNVEDACRQLQQPENQRTHLWGLYCCDSMNCGVYIGTLGQSPSVDLIINECQNIGYFSIVDPGPPVTSYCASSTPDTTKSSSSSHTPTIEIQNIPTIGTFPPDSVTSSASTSIYTSETTTSLVSTQASSSSASIANSSDSTGAGSTRLSGGAKAAIGIFSVLAVLAIVAILLLLFRRRRSNSRGSLPGALLVPRYHDSYSEARSGSRTPLITPPPPTSSRNAPLAPPARLSDRRYLQSILKQGAPRPLATSSTGDLAFPASPICAPGQSSIQSKPVPRHERRATASSIKGPSTITSPTPAHYAQSSVYSLSSGHGASTATIGSNKASSINSGSATVIGTSTPPLSPTRLARTHNGTLESPDLVTPAGPPPNRALPAPPLNHPNSPTFSVSPVSPVSPRSLTFPVRSLVRGGSPIVPMQQGSSKAAPAAASTQELCDLTDLYARGSWGSWSGVGGGGPGVNPRGRKRGSGSPKGSVEKKGEAKTAVALQELDLEKLSGHY
ncbi:hypothetical protein F5Y19DRAFT_206892 [Xylariaceae sp. FL1651]|nr:hypothetical protein F5Y19DRAFT_206892 [Xylariaceae sp. FL1651]